MAKKKNTKKTQIIQLTPKKYIETKARQLPMEKCLMNITGGLVSILVIRKMPSGKFIVGYYLVDIFCLGLKSTDFRFNLSQVELDTFINLYENNIGYLEQVEYVFVHNYIFGAIAYAEDLGFKPHKDLMITQYILEEDNEDIELIEYEFGSNGKPLYISGPYDDREKIIAILRRTAGEGNFLVLEGYGNGFEGIDFGDFYDSDDSEDEDDDMEDTNFEIIEDKK